MPLKSVLRLQISSVKCLLMPKDSKTVGTAKMIAYASPVVATSFLAGGAIMVLQGIYAKHYGLALTSIATVLLISQLFDAITDPVVGYLSDLHYGRNGSRKPFVVCGGLLFILSSIFLYAPIVDVTFTYFLVCFLAYFLAVTLFDIPHSAWGSEISRDSKVRTHLFAYRAVAMNFGFLLFFALPQLPMFETTEFTPETMKWVVIIAGVLLLPTLYICMKFVPDGYQIQASKTVTINSGKNLPQTNKSVVKAVMSNKPFLLFMGAFFFAMTGAGMYFSMVFIYVDAYLGFGDKFSLLSLIGLVVGTLAVGFWYQVAVRLDKKITWALGVLCILAGTLAMGLVSSAENSFWLLVPAMVLIYFGIASVNVISPSLLSDLIDYCTWKDGGDYAASYFSVYGMVIKATWAIGAAMALGLAGWYGFDPAATVHTSQAVFGLHLGIVWLPALIMAFSLVFITLVPINAHRHAIICKALDRREVRHLKVQAERSLPSSPIDATDHHKSILHPSY